MGLRGPKPRSEFEKWLKGNPGKRRLNYPEAGVIAPDFAGIVDNDYSALGWLQRAAARPKSGGRRRKKAAKDQTS